jgi:hypothetical protein
MLGAVHRIARPHSAPKGEAAHRSVEILKSRSIITACPSEVQDQFVTEGDLILNNFTPREIAISH